MFPNSQINYPVVSQCGSMSGSTVASYANAEFLRQSGCLSAAFTGAGECSMEKQVNQNVAPPTTYKPKGGGAPGLLQKMQIRIIIK